MANEDTAMSRALLMLLIATVVAACNGAATVGDPEDDHAPLPDTRLVAIELRLRNVGDGAYEGEIQPRPATRITTDDGTRHFQNGLSDASVIECEETLSALTLASAETRTGCVVFGLEPGEDGGDLETFQLMLDGEGGRPLRWQLSDEPASGPAHGESSGKDRWQ